jgi:hypothetical protein
MLPTKERLTVIKGLQRRIFDVKHPLSKLRAIVRYLRGLEKFLKDCSLQAAE